MKDCIIILPYFGRFHNYFQLFLRTCGKNDKFTWLIITDDKSKYDYPDNIIVEYMSFSDFRDMVQKKFPFQISLDKPYKLCDYRPAYGYIFEERISEYQYWGHCDCDLLFGDLNSKVLPLFDKGYDKIFAAGHLTFYKNNSENNRQFWTLLDGRCYFKQYSLENALKGFDEDGGNVNNIHRIYKTCGLPVYDEDISYNCNALYHNFRRSKYSNLDGKWHVEPWTKSSFYWENGKILQLIYSDSAVIKREYIYMHFQGRKTMRIENEESVSNTLRICPGKFVYIDKRPEKISEIKKVAKKECNLDVLRLFIFRQKLKLGKLKVGVLNFIKRGERYDT